MIVIDTNVLVRIIAKDDMAQAQQAAALLSQDGPFWIGREVFLELAWTLRSSYNYRKDDIARALFIVAALERTEVEGGDDMRRAIQLFANGLDFGDAMVVAFAPRDSEIASFDRRFVARAPPDAHVRLVGDLVRPK